MSSIIIRGNGNKRPLEFPKVEITKAFWGGWNIKITHGGAVSNSKISDFTNYVTQQMNGVTVKGEPFGRGDGYSITVTYDGISKKHVIFEGKTWEVGK